MHKLFEVANGSDFGPTLFNMTSKVDALSNGRLRRFKATLSPSRPPDRPAASGWDLGCGWIDAADFRFYVAGESQPSKALDEFATRNMTYRFKVAEFSFEDPAFPDLRVRKHVFFPLEDKPILVIRTSFTNVGSSDLSLSYILEAKFDLTFRKDPMLNMGWVDEDTDSLVWVNKLRGFTCLLRPTRRPSRTGIGKPFMNCLQERTLRSMRTPDENMGLLEFSLIVQPGETEDVGLTVAAAENPWLAERYVKLLPSEALEARLAELGKDIEAYYMLETPDDDFNRLFAFSNHYVRSCVHIADIGLLATAGYSYYGFWTRDALWTMRGLIRVGEQGLVRELLSNLARFQLDPSNTSISIEKTWIGRGTRPGDEPLIRRYWDSDYFREHRGAFPTTVFFDGALEIYGEKPDIDSTALWVIVSEDYVNWTGDIDYAKKYVGQAEKAVAYLQTRDEDGDGLVEHGMNEDEADCLMRMGKTTFSQCMWFQALRSVATLERAVNHEAKAKEFDTLANRVKDVFNRVLWLEDKGYYADYIWNGVVSDHLHQDTALAVAFGLADQVKVLRLLENMKRLLDTPFGHRMVYPAYAYTLPVHLSEGQYLNGGIWSWHSGYEALAHFLAGEPEDGLYVMSRPMQLVTDSKINPEGKTLLSPYEWIDAYTGKASGSKDLANNCGTFIWATIDGMIGFQASYDGRYDIKPRLPGRWSQVSVKGLRYHDQTLDITVDRQSGVKVQARP
jgi:hypothetical protein